MGDKGLTFGLSFHIHNLCIRVSKTLTSLRIWRMLASAFFVRQCSNLLKMGYVRMSGSGNLYTCRPVFIHAQSVHSKYHLIY